MSVKALFSSAVYARHASAAALLLTSPDATHSVWFLRGRDEQLKQHGAWPKGASHMHGFLYCIDATTGDLFLASAFSCESAGAPVTLSCGIQLEFADVYTADSKHTAIAPPEAIRPWLAAPVSSAASPVFADLAPFSSSWLRCCSRCQAKIPSTMTACEWFWLSESVPFVASADDAYAAEATLVLACHMAGVPTKSFLAAPVRYPHVLGFAVQCNLLGHRRDESLPADTLELTHGRVRRRVNPTVLHCMRSLPAGATGHRLSVAVCVGECLRAFAVLSHTKATDHSPLLAALHKSKLLRRYMPVVARAADKSMLVRLVPTALFKTVFENCNQGVNAALLQDERFTSMAAGSVVYPVLSINPLRFTHPVYGQPDLTDEQEQRIKQVASHGPSSFAHVQDVPVHDDDTDETGQSGVAQKLQELHRRGTAHEEKKHAPTAAAAAPSAASATGAPFYGAGYSGERENFATAPFPLYRRHNNDSAWCTWCLQQLQLLPHELRSLVDAPQILKLREDTQDAAWFTPTLATRLGVTHIEFSKPFDASALSVGSLLQDHGRFSYSGRMQTRHIDRLPANCHPGVDCGILRAYTSMRDVPRLECAVTILCRWDCNADGDVHRAFLDALAALSLTVVADSTRRFALPFHSNNVTACDICPVFCV